MRGDLLHFLLRLLTTQFVETVDDGIAVDLTHINPGVSRSCITYQQNPDVSARWKLVFLVNWREKEKGSVVINCSAWNIHHCLIKSIVNVEYYGNCSCVL